MYTLKLDEIRSLTPTPELDGIHTFKRRNKRKGTKQSGSSRQEASRETLAKRIVELEDLLMQERGRSESLAKQVIDQFSLLSSIEAQHQRTPSQPPSDSSMSNVGHLQSQVMQALTVIHNKAAKTVHEHDQELEKITELRVAEVRKVLESERSAHIREKEMKEKELETLRKQYLDCKESLERTQSDLKQACRLISELQTSNQNYEMSRQLLHRQIIDLKRDNQRLVQDQHVIIGTNSPISPFPNPVRKLSTPMRSRKTLQTTEDQPPSRFDYVISKLRHMLELERKNLRAARSALATELQSKTEVEGLLKDCMQDVKAQIKIAKTEGGREGRLTPGDRNVIMEVLLEQKRVLELLHDKAFPRSGSKIDVPGLYEDGTSVDIPTSIKDGLIPLDRQIGNLSPT